MGFSKIQRWLSMIEAGPNGIGSDGLWGIRKSVLCNSLQGEFLILLTENAFQAIEGKSKQGRISKIQRTVGKGSRLTAEGMIKRLRKLTLNLINEDATIVVIKRVKSNA